MRKFIFDVDGTLTPSRGVIDSNFKIFFNKFCADNDVYLVTGSDRDKTIEQIGEDTYNLCTTVFNCNGNSQWHRGEKGFQKTWILPKAAHDWLSIELSESNFPKRTGEHFDHRPGMINFSVVGRGATRAERNEYVAYDTLTKERERIAKDFNIKFPGLVATIGGETGIDISPEGKDKSQILIHFDPDDELHFFGDSMAFGGNDYPLAQKIIDKSLGYCYNVNSWKATFKILGQI